MSASLSEHPLGLSPHHAVVMGNSKGQKWDGA